MASQARARARLAGVIAAHGDLPVIGVPMLQGMDSLLATVQMPAGIPVATVSHRQTGCDQCRHSGRADDRTIRQRNRRDSRPTRPTARGVEKKLNSRGARSTSITSNERQVTMGMRTGDPMDPRISFSNLFPTTRTRPSTGSASWPPPAALDLASLPVRARCRLYTTSLRPNCFSPMECCKRRSLRQAGGRSRQAFLEKSIEQVSGLSHEGNS